MYGDITSERFRERKLEHANINDKAEISKICGLCGNREQLKISIKQCSICGGNTR